MSRTSGEEGFQAKADGCEADSGKFSTKWRPSSSRQWSAFKNPRIVSVSRAFGGKDRHSKVCTIKGLKDRRIRLSVPTAIQLYDLQDRLGLDQPSKAVDWLLDATKSDIDKLPPLPIPPTGIFPQSSFFSENSVGGVQSSLFSSKEAQNHEGQSGGNFNYIPQVSAQNFFPIAAHSSFTNLLNNVAPPYNSYGYLEPSALSLSQFGIHGLFPPQATGVGSTTPYTVVPAANGTRQINYRFLGSIGHPAVSASTSKFLHPHLQINDEREHDLIKGSSTAS